MDKPGASKDSFSGENADEEMMKMLPVNDMAIHSDDEDDQSQAGAVEEERNGNDSDLPAVEDIIAECEKTLKMYMKHQSANRRLAVYRGNTTLDSPIDDSSIVFIDFEKSLIDQRVNTFRNVRKERLIDGSWLFLSNINGGWDYDHVKDFFITEFDVKYLKNMPERLEKDTEYKAVIKFRSSQELNRVVKILKDKKLYNNFLFFSFDKIPITYYDSESDSEDDTYYDSDSDYEEVAPRPERLT